MIIEDLSKNRTILTYVQVLLREIQPRCGKCLYWSDAGECRKETPWSRDDEDDEHGFWVVTNADDYCGDLVMLNPDYLPPEVVA